MSQLPFGSKGPAEVTWAYGESSEMILNPTFGKISLKQEDGVSPIEEEEHGQAPVDAVFTGTKTELEVPMTDSTLAQLAAMIHGEVISGDVMIISNRSGCSMYDDAKPILIKPLCDNVPNTDPSTWILIYKAYPYRAYDLGFDRDSQRVVLVKFMIFPSQESGCVGEILQIGVAEEVV
jgi:hypothetical protein